MALTRDWTIEAKQYIQESFLIRAIHNLLTRNSCLLLDLDNTVMENLTILGSDQWFCKLMSYACQIIPDTTDAIACVIAIYHEVQHHLRVKAVEEEIITIIKDAKSNGIPVIAITARALILKETTQRQLEEIGIYFDKIIFCEGKDKGECLKRELKQGEWPDHFVMADDKENHVLHVAAAILSLGKRFNGIRYSHLDEKVKAIETHMERANYELAQIHSRLSSSTQMIIKKLRLLENIQTCEPPGEEFYHIKSSKQEMTYPEHPKDEHTSPNKKEESNKPMGFRL